MNIERKVDMLISGMKLPKKKTRSRVVTIATSLLIAIAIIASASIVNFYYIQTAEIDVTSLITIDGQDQGWKEGIIIGGTGEAVFYAGTTKTIGPYTIAYADVTGETNPPITVYFHIAVTEELITDTPGNPTGDCAGLIVEVYNGGVIDQITLVSGASETFTIHITAAPLINAASTYAYTITMDWEQ